MIEPPKSDKVAAGAGRRYFTATEVTELCGIKRHVLPYWEREFPQLNPIKRRNNRRYYQRRDIDVIRQIRSLLYDQGFTVEGAREVLSRSDLAE